MRRLLNVLLLLPALALGTPVDFKAAIDAVEGDSLASSTRIRLVDANGLQIQGAVSTSGRPVTTSYQLDLAVDAETSTLEILPQSQIARPDGSATWYQIDIRIGSNVASYRVQVPDSVETQDLVSLVGAAAIDPADITAARLIPPGGTTGQVLAKTSATDYATQWSTASNLVGAITPSALTLTQPVWEDLRFPAQGINPAGSAAPPTVDTSDGALLFSSSQTNIIAGVAQLPHSWVEGTAVIPHIHWTATSTNVGNVDWLFEYEAQSVGSPFAGMTQSNSLSASGGSADVHLSHLLTPVGISMTGKLISTIIKWRLSRIGGDPSDTYTGNAKLLELDFHYQINRLGSVAETSN